MRKRCYTKIKNLLINSNELHLHAANGYVYASEGHLVIKMPDEMYEETFHAKNRCDFPILEDGEQIRRMDAGWYTHNTKDLVSTWDRLFDDTEKYQVRFVDSGKYTYELHQKAYTKLVRFCETEYDRVMLNPRFYEAMEQATRGGLVYGHNRRSPVWFFDSPEICNSALRGCVLPIMYRDDQVVAA